MKFRRATIPMTLQRTANVSYTPAITTPEPSKAAPSVTRVGMLQNIQNTKQCGTCGKR